MSHDPIPHAPLRRAALGAVAVSSMAMLAIAACNDVSSSDPTRAAAERIGGPGTRIQYGTPLKVGGGRARAYLALDEKNGNRTIELGVALDESAMNGLPQHGSGGGPHGNFVEYLLQLPTQNTTPFKFVELDWNPMGHGEPYTQPHFDFHFYTVSLEERNAIDPSDPEFATKAANYPAAGTIPTFYANPAVILGIPPASIAVPRMGIHWVDVRSPELQAMAGHPDNYQPFTKTFIYGSWNGKLTFMEPMITREYIMAKRASTNPAVIDERIAISTSTGYPPGAFHPSAYRITYDAQAKEYRIALTTVAGQ
jgi:hypothetical protein